jgi:hypothetical protein
VTVHLREPSFASQETLFNIVELSGTSLVRVAILDLRKKTCH